jgi:hypothetical protein
MICKEIKCKDYLTDEGDPAWCYRAGQPAEVAVSKCPKVPGEKGRKNMMAVMAKKYSCKNCGSIFVPSLKADFEHIKVQCSFCHYGAVLVPVPEFITPEQYKERTGEDWPEGWAVYVLNRSKHTKEKVYRWEAYSYYATRTFRGRNPIVCATEAGKPPKSWRPE